MNILYNFSLIFPNMIRLSKYTIKESQSDYTINMLRLSEYTFLKLNTLSKYTIKTNQTILCNLTHYQNTQSKPTKPYFVSQISNVCSKSTFLDVFSFGYGCFDDSTVDWWSRLWRLRLLESESFLVATVDGGGRLRV